MQIRVKSIIDGLIEKANPKGFPTPLVTFLSSYFSDGSHVPKDFLS
jgi:hypothetical protein